MSAQRGGAEERLNDLKLKFELLLEGNAELQSTKVYEQLAKVLPRLDEPVAVSFVGSFKTGKSSTLNAIVGQRLSPVDAPPATALACYFRYGDTSRARFVHQTGQAEDTTFDELRRVVDQTQQTPASVAKRKLLSHAEIFHPAEVLREVMLVDTPGLNSQNKADDERALAHMAQADALCWLFDANAGGVTAETLAHIQRILPHVRAPWAVLNRCDDKPPSERRQVLAGMQRAVGGHFRKIFPYSARLAEHRAQGKAVHPEDAEGLDLRFIDEVVRSVRAEARELRVPAAARVLLEAIDIARRTCEEVSAARLRKRTYLKSEALPTLRREEEAIRASHLHAFAGLTDEVKRVLSRFVAEFDGVVRKGVAKQADLNRELERVSANWTAGVKIRVEAAVGRHKKQIESTNADSYGPVTFDWDWLIEDTSRRLAQPLDRFMARTSGAVKALGWTVRTLFGNRFVDSLSVESVNDCLSFVTNDWQDLKDLQSLLADPVHAKHSGAPYSFVHEEVTKQLEGIVRQGPDQSKLQNDLTRVRDAAQELAGPGRGGGHR